MGGLRLSVTVADAAACGLREWGQLRGHVEARLSGVHDRIGTLTKPMSVQEAAFALAGTDLLPEPLRSSETGRGAFSV